MPNVRELAEMLRQEWAGMPASDEGATFSPSENAASFDHGTLNTVQAAILSKFSVVISYQSEI